MNAGKNFSSIFRKRCMDLKWGTLELHRIQSEICSKVCSMGAPLHRNAKICLNIVSSNQNHVCNTQYTKEKCVLVAQIDFIHCDAAHHKGGTLQLWTFLDIDENI